MFNKFTYNIDFFEPQRCFARVLRSYKYKFLQESLVQNDAFYRSALIGIDPCLKIEGSGEEFQIEVLNSRGHQALESLELSNVEFIEGLQVDSDVVSGCIKSIDKLESEQLRCKKQNLFSLIRLIQSKMAMKDSGKVGLYGPLSYDSIRQVEESLRASHQFEVPDFTLFLYDTFIHFDMYDGLARVELYRGDCDVAAMDLKLIQKILSENTDEINSLCKVSNLKFAKSQDEFESDVEQARQLASRGELFEIVLSNILTAQLDGSAFALYQKYTQNNPSPYCFYYDIGKRILFGTSPEMMTRVRGGQAELRPISGTIKRGDCVLSDYRNLCQLLDSQKERSELDMLVDLGRNDLSRVCANVSIQEYRVVERYKHLFHTVSHLTGDLREGFEALDVLLSTFPHGTLTGAPKVAAMKYIDQIENQSRQYYGGTILNLRFDGDLDSCIMIRFASVHDGVLRYQTGATLLFDSDPESEYQELMTKARGFLLTINSIQK